MQQLEAVFSRSGFTDGYYTGKRGVNMFGVRSREDVLSATGKVFQSVHGLYKDERQSVPLEAELSVKRGEPSRLTVMDEQGRSVTVQGAVPEEAVKVPLTFEKCEASLRKTGGTPFFIREVRGEPEEGLSLPALALNALRREALQKLLEQRSRKDPVPFVWASLPESHTRSGKLLRYVRARFPHGNVPDAFLDCELIYVPLSLRDEEYNSLMDRGFAVAAEIPRGMFGMEQQLFRRLRELKAIGVEEVLANNLGAVQMARELNMDIHGGFGLNLTNTASLEWAESMGLMDAEVSFELTLQQIRELGGRIPIGILSGGRIPLMLTRNCPADNAPGKAPMELHDRKGMIFPLQTCGSCTEVLNSVPLELSDRKRELSGIDFEVLRYSVENSVETVDSFEIFNSQKGRKSGFTRGLYYRGVE